jgi:uracil-DNA glycosylase family 4
VSSARSALARVEAEVVACRRCPRLVAWREEVARTKRAAFREEEYWGRPVPGFGDPAAWLLIVGLAPAAHGANRTGRMFTGDRSGDWLYRALHKAGLATQPDSTHRGDALDLNGTFITAGVRCAPPGNRPTPAERDACRPYLERELDVLSEVRVIVALGGFAWASVARILRDRGHSLPRPMPRFSHAAEVPIHPAPVAESPGARPQGGGSRGGGWWGGGSRGGGWPERGPGWLIGSYHPSQQNTFTGKLTEEMFDVVWERARQLRNLAPC